VNTLVSISSRPPGSYRPTLRQLGAALCTGVLGGLFVGGIGALPAALLAAAGSLVLQRRLVVERDRQATGRLIAAAPPLVDLFAAALGSGLLPADAALTVAAAFEERGPETGTGRAAVLKTPAAVLASRFRAAGDELRAGTDPELAWRALTVDEATAAVGAAALRSSRTGAPAALAVAKAAQAGRITAQHAMQAQVRACAVRAAAPLALCFLPAFILIGVLPTAVGLLDTLQP
jgi:hypothetical protein